MKRLLISIFILSLPLNVGAADIKKFFAGWSGMQANFEQRVYDADNTLQELSKGMLSIGMPSKFKLK